MMQDFTQIYEFKFFGRINWAPSGRYGIFQAVTAATWSLTISFESKKGTGQL